MRTPPRPRGSRDAPGACAEGRYMQPERIQDLEVLLGHSFRDKSFLLNALSHSSIKTDRRPSN